MKSTKDILKGLIVGLVLAAGVTVLAAWNEPTQAPTGGNPEAPLNVSNTSQSKGGNLTVNGNNMHQNALIAPFGAIVIGDSSPETGAGGLKLDVEGKAGAAMFCDQNGANCFSAATLCQEIEDLCN